MAMYWYLYIQLVKLEIANVIRRETVQTSKSRTFSVTEIRQFTVIHMAVRWSNKLDGGFLKHFKFISYLQRRNNRGTIDHSTENTWNSSTTLKLIFLNYTHDFSKVVKINNKIKRRREMCWTTRYSRHHLQVHIDYGRHTNWNNDIYFKRELKACSEFVWPFSHVIGFG